MKVHRVNDRHNLAVTCFVLHFSPSGRPVYAEFKHFNIYRSTLYFHDVSGMTPLMSGNQEPSLQSPATHSYKDMYPPANVDLYYAVTIVNGNGQEETKVDIRKVCSETNTSCCFKFAYCNVVNFFIL